ISVCGETAALRAVLAAGAHVSTPDVHGGYPLHYAAQMCGGERDSNLGLQVLQTLLQHPEIKVSVTDVDKREPLLWAASAGSAKAVLALIRAGATVEAADKDGLTALHCAASRGHTDCMDTLLTLCGASVDIIDTNGCTALHYAVTLGHADATALLLAHGADPNRQDRKGRSPAHCGCAKGQFETVKLIGSHGANLWLRNARGDFPLHDAAASGRRELVRWLLEIRPSQVNARNNDGRCSLHMAALNDNADMCKILLDAGAQINPVLRTSKNVFMTPLDCALQRGYRSTAKYLQLHGGVPASRLSDPTKSQVNSALNLQIRDDVTFYGDTSSESERERAGGSKTEAKTVRKRVPHSRQEKKKVSVSGSESEKAKLSRQKSTDKPATSKSEDRKRTPSRIDYSNEITINGKTEVNISQSGEIVLDKESVQTQTSAKFAEKDRRPRSAKYSRLRDKSAQSSLNKETMISISSQASVSKIDHSTSTSEEGIDTAKEGKKTVAQTESSPPEKDNSEEQKQLSGPTQDRHSLMSYTSEDVEEPKKEIIVEASVHPQPQVSSQAEKEAPQPITQITSNVSILVETPRKDTDIEIAKMEEKIVDTTEQEEKKEVSEQVEKSDVTPIDSEQKEGTGIKNKDLELPQEIEVTQSIIKIEDECQPPSGDFAPQVDETEGGSQQISKTAEGDTDINKNAAQNGQTDLPLQVVPDQTGIQGSSKQEKQEVISTDALETVHEKESTEIEKEKQIKVNEQTFPVNKLDETVPQPSESDEIHASSEQKDILKESKKKHDEHASKPEETRLEKNGKTDQKKKLKDKTVTEVKARSRKIEKSETQSKVPKPRKHKQEEDSKHLSDVSSYSEDEEFPERSHKSFRILTDKELDEIDDTKRRKPRPKRDLSVEEPRSKSLENKAKKDMTKRSKIPLFKSNLSKSDRHLNQSYRETNLDTRIPSLPNIRDERHMMREPMRCDSNMSAPLLTSMLSDKDRDSISDLEDEKRNITKSKRFVKRRSKTREARSAGSDYESSNLIDSGFEPSPRSTRVPKWKNMTERGVNMISVTQNIQTNIRRYHLERKIFQQLLELKRHQIRAGQHNEAVLVKRAIDAYHKSCASTVGVGRYITDDYTFKSFEKFLYEALRKLQRNGAEYMRGLPETPVNPLLCTKSTNRCMHAAHAYTGVPCAAYLPKMDHHSIPKIGFNSVECKPGTGGFLPTINPKKAVTLELTHGSDKQIISLPTNKLDQNKRYYVTFTVKGHDAPSDADNVNNNNNGSAHKHSKSD
uniref:Ankycorbin n=1 Tax=Diabrotica virgifera virgifera TaxID=50390 RepID=A0A6P7FWT9_DIAVI